MHGRAVFGSSLAWLVVVGLGLGLGCGGRSGAAVPGSVTPAGQGAAGVDAGVMSGDAGGGTPAPGCSDLFAEDRLTDYAIDVAPDEWAKLDYEFHNRAAAADPTTGQTPYHPIVLHYGSETVTDASMRLKGDSSWDQTVALDGALAKMQFVISFQEKNPNGRFHGESRIVLDMPRDDGTFLQERLAFRALNELLGHPAPCANNARLTVNGQYYGLYANEEHVGHTYLDRAFPGASGGDLFKAGYSAETNTANPNWSRLATFWAARDAASMSAIVDMGPSIEEWAAEALFNDADGYYGGSHNFYLYDYPGAGYRWLVCDADTSFDWLGSPAQHPIYWWISPRNDLERAGQHYLIVMKDPTWRARYIASIRALLPRWDVGQLQGWIDAWAAQIADAAATDPHTINSPADHVKAIAGMRDLVSTRADYLRSFLGCQDGTGDTTDGDGDGFAWCNDCDDTHAAVNPGAAEICGNGIDDDCNGFADAQDAACGGH
jgi:hypothetical protein